MKAKLLLLLLPFYCAYPQASKGSAEIIYNTRQKAPLTKVQEAAVWLNVQSNVALLQQCGRLHLASPSHRQLASQLQWPLASTNPMFKETWYISDYPDDNMAFPNQKLDYNCGSQTFDDSTGNNAYLVLGLNPFPFYQSENNVTSIVAAASGTITYKDDSNPETACGATPGTNANSIVVLNQDGTYAYYVGVKHNTATTKMVGDTVAAGEFLGYVGNAGTSDGYPYLYFKLLDTNANANAPIDPFAGLCNTAMPISMWAQQPSYVNSKINAVFTHFALPNFAGCPELTNFKDTFTNPDPVVMVAYITDMVQGAPINFQLQRPDGTLALNENTTLANTFKIAYFGYTESADTFDQTGTWIARFTYNGIVAEHSFVYNSSLGTNYNDVIANTLLYPNPTSGVLSIQSEIAIDEARITDTRGRLISFVKQNDIKQLDISRYSKGVYFVELRSSEGKALKRIVKN